jgi:hypothetical protein
MHITKHPQHQWHPMFVSRRVCHAVCLALTLICVVPQGERRAGFVGLPLPGVEVKVVPVADDAEGSGHDGVDDDDGNNDDDTASAQGACQRPHCMFAGCVGQMCWLSSTDILTRRCS